MHDRQTESGEDLQCNRRRNCNKWTAAEKSRIEASSAEKGISKKPPRPAVLATAIFLPRKHLGRGIAGVKGNKTDRFNDIQFNTRHRSRNNVKCLVATRTHGNNKPAPWPQLLDQTRWN